MARPGKRPRKTTGQNTTTERIVDPVNETLAGVNYDESRPGGRGARLHALLHRPAQVPERGPAGDPLFDGGGPAAVRAAPARIHRCRGPAPDARTGRRIPQPAAGP